MKHRVVDLRVRRQSAVVSVEFDSGERFDLPFEYLRVFSPSAEVGGHGLPEPRLVGGKSGVAVESVTPVGNYAVRLAFDDGHRTGLYSWDVLHDLGVNQAQNWQRYLQRIDEAGMSRDPQSNVVPLSVLTGKNPPPDKDSGQ